MKAKVEKLTTNNDSLEQKIVITKNNTDILAEINIDGNGFPISSTVDGKKVVVTPKHINDEDNTTSTNDYSIDYGDDYIDKLVPVKDILTKDKNGKTLKKERR